MRRALRRNDVMSRQWRVVSTVMMIVEQSTKSFTSNWWLDCSSLLWLRKGWVRGNVTARMWDYLRSALNMRNDFLRRPSGDTSRQLVRLLVNETTNHARKAFPLCQTNYPRSQQKTRSFLLTKAATLSPDDAMKINKVSELKNLSSFDKFDGHAKWKPRSELWCS